MIDILFFLFLIKLEGWYVAEPPAVTRRQEFKKARGFSSLRYWTQSPSPSAPQHVGMELMATVTRHWPIWKVRKRFRPGNPDRPSWSSKCEVWWHTLCLDHGWFQNFSSVTDQMQFQWDFVVRVVPKSIIDLLSSFSSGQIYRLSRSIVVTRKSIASLCWMLNFKEEYLRKYKCDSRISRPCHAAAFSHFCHGWLQMLLQ